MPFDYKKVRFNVVLLSAIQAFDYAIPLVAIPYLLHTLGAVGYGKIAFVQAFCSYFVLLIDFGFNWTGVRDIAVNASNKEYIARLFWRIQIIRFILCSISIGVIWTAIIWMPGLSPYASVLKVGCLILIGAAIYPLWLLQGLEKLRESALIQISVRLLMLMCVFVFIKGEQDLVLAAVLLMVSTPLSGIIALLFLSFGRNIDWRQPSRSELVSELLNSWHVFLTSAASSVYRSSSAVVLGLVTGPQAVAYFATAEKVVKATQEMTRPIVQATYASVSALASSDRNQCFVLLRKIFYFIFFFCALSSSVLLFFAGDIVYFFYGKYIEEARSVLMFLAFVPLVGGLNSVLGVQTLHALNFSKSFSYMVVLTGAFHLLVIFPSVYWYAENGAAVCFLASEMFLLGLLVRFHFRNNILVLPKLGGVW
ncbi:oligosaccharide flippase family protein [Rhodoferax aquaticus]|uniref:Flippase n=1 Tax=Rhodoferax aquaticus TaxID=2527691 RepID=A0A515EPK7_9BURK|nr:oligosaccharide flippase family protein [Rhodoferax aquaticus]QDL54555.1 hypothetical protein EXZ61_10470 [Rhodoferax aquaticus]